MINKVVALLLALHILGGSVGLLTGSFNLFRKKGDNNHRLAGKLFIAGMLVTGITSLMLAAYTGNFFLFVVGVFTSYLVATGQRAIFFKREGGIKKPGFLDWSITLAMLLAGLVFLVWGALRLAHQNVFGMVLLVFGLLGLAFVRADLRHYRKGHIFPVQWLLTHLQRITGAYVAALTAFLVVNIKYLPDYFPAVVVWLIPTLILTPLIVFWSRKYGEERKVKSRD